MTKVESLRGTKLYKDMTAYLATAYAEGFLEGEKATEKEILTAWQWLHDRRIAYNLQGWFGRTANDLVNRGIIEA